MKEFWGSFVKLVPLGALRILGIGLAFLQAVFLARFFGAEVYGILTFSMSIIAIIGLVFSFGMNEFLMREIAARGLTAARKDRELHGMLRFAAWTVCPAAVVITMGGIALFGLMDLGGPYGLALLIVTATYPIRVVRQFTEALAVAVKKQALSILGSKIAFPIIMIIGTLAYAEGGGASFTTPGIILLYALAMFISTVVAVALVRPDIRTLFTDSPDPARTDTRRVFVSAMLMGAVMSANLIILHMDTILLGTLASPEEAAYARVGQKLAEAIGLILVIAMIQYRPLLAETHGQGDRDGLARHVDTLSKLLSGFGIASFAVMVIFAPFFAMLFGPEYVTAIPALRAYAFGALALMLAGPGTLLLMMTGREAIASRILWTVLVCNLVLDLIAVPKLGAFGAGLATAVSQSLLAVLTVQACRKHTGLDPSILSYLRRAPGG
ncbi:polysaccharide biosynthesis C-terminal domain-containing protein [Pseudoroseicyclus tamaricis]|uniref:Oligosaccharide flippase family protein n=1 Tax=Pseudoroseicyclus tamaricis TaxID=2705421 RepID=A0A6B2K0N0_9RHOB|nr:polysaccharide biosynthesis C-terminal domain-containing protein [Pseudoroseicyclus tamaricis]NDV01242.1 oligosaccharide flippase family protein [Pseudoroseicyclus tamaricis]